MLIHAVTAALGLIFLVAAFGKLDGWPKWTLTARALFPRSPRLASLLRVGIPAVEVAIGLLVFAHPVLGLAAGAILLVGFAVGVLRLAPSHGAADCNCFGALMPSVIGKPLAARNAVLALLAGGAAGVAARAGAPTFTLVEGLLIALAGATTVLLAELRRLPRQLLRGASELRPREG